VGYLYNSYSITMNGTMRSKSQQQLPPLAPSSSSSGLGLGLGITALPLRASASIVQAARASVQPPPFAERTGVTRYPLTLAPNSLEQGEAALTESGSMPVSGTILPQVDESFVFDTSCLGEALSDDVEANGVERDAERRQSAAAQAKPKSMSRAKIWSPEVEDLFRFQSAGFRDAKEYATQYPEPQRWPANGFVRVLQDSKTGFFKYYREQRECEDKHLKGIKIFTY